MAQVRSQQRDNNPVVVASVIVIALTGMLILAYNFFVQPNRTADLNPVGKHGMRSASPQNSPTGAMDNNSTSNTK